jgi:hypothetical protein
MESLKKSFELWKSIKTKKIVKKIFKNNSNIYSPKKARKTLDLTFQKIQEPSTHFKEMIVHYFQKNNQVVPLIAHTILIIFNSSDSIEYIDNDISTQLTTQTIRSYLNEIKKGEIVDISMNAITFDNHYGYPEIYSIKAFP